MRVRIAALTAILALVMASITVAQDDGFSMTKLGTYNPGIGEAASEIVSYDAGTQALFVTNGAEGTIDVISIADPSAPELLAQVELEGAGGNDAVGGGANSVSVSNGLGVAAVENAEDFQPGFAVFFDAATYEVVEVVQAGVLPDMITFTPDGSKVLVANEGEPSDDYSIDPEGSITVIDVATFEATQLTFEAFNDEIPENVRVFGPDATLAQDLEPEFITVSPDSSTAFVIAQENNTMIVVDLTTNEIAAIAGLGYKDYSAEGNAIDASNEDGEINIANYPVFGMYQPDSIAAYEVDGEILIVTANEGDARDYDTFSEEDRIADITLDEEAFPNAAELQDEAVLGRLLITNTLGDTDGDGDFDELYNYGARSFTIWNTDLEIVFDSGNAFETLTAEMVPEIFNSNGLPDSFDQRSDDKGPEPEALALGTIGDQTYAFIGMERVGGIFVYNITDPANATYVTYFNDVNIEGTLEDGTAGDISPEGIKFISADDSPTGTALIAVAYEISGTTVVYEVSN